MTLTEQEMDEITKFVNSGIKKELPNYGFLFFTVILELAPDAKNMFSFLKDRDGLPDQEHIDPKFNSKLNSHAKSVLKNTWNSAAQLRRDGKVKLPPATPKTESFGSIHHKSGVMDHHFEVVKVALIRTVKEAMGEKWSEEMKSTWCEAYDELGAAIRAEMKLEAAKHTTTILIDDDKETDATTAAIKARVRQDSAAEEEEEASSSSSTSTSGSTNSMVVGPVAIVVLCVVLVIVWKKYRS